MYEFLFSDIEHSTEKWERHKDAMSKALVRHDGIVKVEIARRGGRLVKHTGDGIFAVFENKASVACALGMQTRIVRADWREIGGLRIRAAVHAGDAERRGEDYFGPAVNVTARVMALAKGGQILLTPAALDICGIPDGGSVESTGTHALKGITEAQQVLELAHPDLSEAAGADEGPVDVDGVNPADLVQVQHLLQKHLEARSFVEGIVQFRRLAGAHPQSAQLMLNLAILYDRGGYGREAIGAYERVLLLDPMAELVYRYLAARLATGRYYSEAVKVARQGLERFPKSERLHFIAGYALAMKQQPAEAEAEFQAELEVSPGYQDAAYNLQLLRSKAPRPLLFRVQA